MKCKKILVRRIGPPFRSFLQGKRLTVEVRSVQMCGILKSFTPIAPRPVHDRMEILTLIMAVRLLYVRGFFRKGGYKNPGNSRHATARAL